MINPYKAPMEEKLKPSSLANRENEDILLMMMFTILFLLFSVWYNDITIQFIKNGHVVETIKF